MLRYHNRDANSSQKYHPRCFLVVLVVKKLTCQCKNAVLGFRRKLEAGDVDSVIGLYVVYVLGEHRIIREDNCAGHSTRGSRLTPIKRLSLHNSLFSKFLSSLFFFFCISNPH